MNALAGLTGSPWTLFLFDASLKAAIVLAAAWGACLLLALFRSSAALRHLVWSLAICGVLAVPLLAAMLPTWSIRLITSQPASPTAVSAAASAEQPEVTHHLLAWTPETEPSAPSKSEPSPAGSAVIPTAADSPADAASNWVLWTWLIGACLALVPTWVAAVSLWSLGRRSRRVQDGPLLAAMQQGMSQLQLKRRVRLVQSEARSMPMTWGLWRPVILLPEEAERWSSDRLRAVLLHELAHVQRRDCVTQLLAQIARAAYWFNPLIWFAERRLRIEQERACDDLVLGQGVAAVEYARHLLEVVAGFRSPPCRAGLAMASTSKIERRLVSILNSRQQRRPVGRGRTGLTTLMACAMISALSVVQFERAAAQAPEQRSDTTPDRSPSLADLRSRILQQAVTPVNESEMIQGAIRGMVGALGDPHADYLAPEMLREIETQLRGTRVGIGVQLEMHDQQVRVVTPLHDSPALQAGIQAGDVLVQIDGQPATGDLKEVVQRIAGPPGTSVRLAIRRAGQEIEVNVRRGTFRIQSVKGFRRGPDTRWDYMLDAARQIAYLRIAEFGSATPQEVRDAVTSLKKQGLNGLILDLRFCPGGALDSAVGVARLFLAGGTIVSLHSREGVTTTISSDASTSLGDFPLVVLVNGQTASAAEVVAGALQDNRRALVLGTRTFGKGSVQTLMKLDEGGGAIKLTTSYYRLPGGRNIDKRPAEKSWGIDPDEGYFVPVSGAQTKALLAQRQEREIIDGNSDMGRKAALTVQGIEGEQADPQLAAALKTLTARLATGEFEKVSQLSAAQIEQIFQRQDIEQRRETVVQSLQQLDRELADLEGQK